SIFFKGRDEHIQQIIAQLEEKKFVMLTGASGDGKSSIVYAGVMPNARAGFFKAKFNNWVIADFRPERSPLKSLSASLAKQLQLDPVHVENELRCGFSALVDLYKSSKYYLDTEAEAYKNAELKEQKLQKRKAANLFILADQFEEFFTNKENFNNGKASLDSQLVINLLLETAKIALSQDIPIYIICTMRSDYIGQCAAFRGLPEYIGFSQFFVPRLKRKEMYQVIQEPAELSGCKISNRLTEILINELREGFDQLPVLQHALHQVWEKADMGNEEMDLQHLAKLGGLRSSFLTESDKIKFEEWFKDLPEYKKMFFEKPSLENVLNAHANELYETAYEYYLQHSAKAQKLNVTDVQFIIKKTFQSLSRIDDGRAVRSRMTVQDVLSIINNAKISEDDVCSTINLFREQGNTFLYPFIQPDQPETTHIKSETILDITHESLIRNWDLLSEWSKEENENRENYLDFVKQLKRWTDNGKSKNYLLPQGPLLFFEKWYSVCIPNKYWIAKYDDSPINIKEKWDRAEAIINDAKEFLNQSRTEAERIEKNKQHKRRLVYLSSAAIIVFLAVFGFIAYKNGKEAELNSKIEKSKSLAAYAMDAKDNDPTLAYLLAEKAWQTYPTRDAEAALINAYYKAPFFNTLVGEDAVVSTNGKFILTTSANDNYIRLYDNSGCLIKTLKGFNGPPYKNSTFFSNNNKFILSRSNADSTIKIWNINGNLVLSVDLKQVTAKFANDFILFGILPNNNCIFINEAGYKIIDLKGKEIKNIKEKIDFNDLISYKFNDYKNFDVLLRDTSGTLVKDNILTYCGYSTKIDLHYFFCNNLLKRINYLNFIENNDLLPNVDICYFPIYDKVYIKGTKKEKKEKKIYITDRNFNLICEYQGTLNKYNARKGFFLISDTIKRKINVNNLNGKLIHSFQIPESINLTSDKVSFEFLDSLLLVQKEGKSYFLNNRNKFSFVLNSFNYESSYGLNKLVDNTILARIKNTNTLFCFQNDYIKSFVVEAKIGTTNKYNEQWEIVGTENDTIAPVIEFIPENNGFISAVYGDDTSNYEYALFDNQGKLILTLTGNMRIGDIVVSQSKKYFSSNINFSIFQIYSLKDLKKQYYKKTNFSFESSHQKNKNIFFIERADTLCSFITNDKFYLLSNEFKLIDSLPLKSKLNPERGSVVFNDRYVFNIVTHEDFINTTGICYDIKKKDSIVVWKNRKIKNPLISENSDLCCYDEQTKDFLVFDVKGKLKNKCKNNSGSMIIKQYNSQNKITYLTTNTQDFYNLDVKDVVMRTAQSVVFSDTYDITTGKKIASFIEPEFDLGGSYIILNERILTTEGYKWNDGKLILKADNIRVSPDNKYLSYLDKDLLKTRVMTIVPDEIIKRVRVVKEFGEIRGFTEYEKKMYNIE
ncbi:MAG: hypothetical protein A2491_12935, partial [Bacteroidetes bacterium RIFOXYC12_FULL_35_7]